MTEPEQFDFVKAEFLDESGRSTEISTDPLSRIVQIDARISYLEFRNSRAESSYEESENNRTIQELRQERAKLMSELSDEQRLSLESMEE